MPQSDVRTQLTRQILGEFVILAFQPTQRPWRGKRATSEHIGVRRAPIFVSRRLCGMYRCRDERASGTAVLKGDRIVAQRVTGAVTRVLCRLCLGNGLQSATTAHRRHEQQRRNEQVQNSPGAVHGLQPSYLTET